MFSTQRDEKITSNTETVQQSSITSSMIDQIKALEDLDREEAKQLIDSSIQQKVKKKKDTQYQAIVER
ncbi:MAG: hypothetical protein JO131_09050, partial [Gammaproteobacteria bacterium]|nr:hypothetical protein [Gammaproteobacteria bacterium]